MSKDAGFMHDVIMEKVDDVSVLATAVRSLTHSYAEFLLLRYCVSQKVGHFNRLLSLKVLLPGFHSLSSVFRGTLSHALHRHCIPDHVWTRAMLPTRMSGTGVGDLVLTHPAVALSSAHLTRRLLELGVSSGCTLSSSMVDVLMRSPDLLIACSTLDTANSAHSHVMNPPPTNVNGSSYMEQLGQDDFPSSRALSEMLQKPVFRSLLELAAGRSRRDEAWLRSCAKYGSGQWLHAMPSHSCFQASESEYLVMLLTRLDVALPMSDASAMPSCALRHGDKPCGMQNCAVMVSGAHWHGQCKGVSAWERHNGVRGDVGCMCKAAGNSVSFEVPGLYAGSDARPADVLISPDPGQDGSVDRAIDVTVADPRGTTPLFQYNSDKQALAAAALAESGKLLQHTARVRDMGLGVMNFEVLPFALESSGALGKHATLLWKSLKKQFKKLGVCNYILHDMPRTWSAFTPFQWFPQRLSFTVAKLTARMVIAGVKASARGGRGWLSRDGGAQVT